MKPKLCPKIMEPNTDNINMKIEIITCKTDTSNKLQIRWKILRCI